MPRYFGSVLMAQRHRHDDQTSLRVKVIPSIKNLSEDGMLLIGAIDFQRVEKVPEVTSPAGPPI